MSSKYILLNSQPGMREIEQKVLNGLNDGTLSVEDLEDGEEGYYMGVSIKRVASGVVINNKRLREDT